MPEPAEHEAPFTIVDQRGRQAFSFTTTKPPVLHQGRTIPAAERNVPDRGSYLVFNDENGDERGGLVTTARNVFLSMDWPNCDALSLGVEVGDANSVAGLLVRSMPDPDLPIEKAWNGSATAAQIGWSSAHGSCVVLHDSQGQPRLVLSVDRDNVPHIQVLDADGSVIRDLIEPA